MSKPVKINLKDDKSLFIKWDDESETDISLTLLRRLCPCATCKTERELEGKNYFPIFNQSQVTIKSVNSVGSYAITISWKDGHSTGIYEYPYLRMLSQEKVVE